MKPNGYTLIELLIVGLILFAVSTIAYNTWDTVRGSITHETINETVTEEDSL